MCITSNPQKLWEAYNDLKHKKEEKKNSKKQKKIELANQMGTEGKK